MNPHIKTRHRVSRVGQLVVDGPFSIEPPQAIDDYGWLECQLRLTHWSGGVVDSAAVYVDDSTNREDDFLRPVIRRVHWTQGEDLRRAIKGELDWPTITVTLSELTHEGTADVDALIRTVLARLTALPIAPSGLNADRSTPDLDIDERGRILVYASNGVQTVRYTSPTSGADGGLTDVVLDGLRVLQDIGTPLPIDAGWRESYQYPLDAPELGGSHWWHYRRPHDTDSPS